MRALSWTLLSFLLSATLAQAAIFPDVPDDHLYKEAVERLVGVQVINGHPDGFFRPGDPVNRAAMLKMLYKAAGKSPDLTKTGCFPDVLKGSWYEAFVCDAAANRYVQGYSDGTFRPGNSVSRTEAIKMILTVLEIGVPELTNLNRELLKFIDVSTSGWYTKYLSAAFNKAILPIPGQGGSRFYPDWPLLRGEAAQYLFNALNVDVMEEREEAQIEIEESEKSSAAASSVAMVSSTASSASSRAQAKSVDVAFPFAQNATFEEKASVSYHFTLAAATVVDVAASIAKGQAGRISCRLYKIAADGLSEEYYLGHEESQGCYLLSAVGAGEYQLQVQPTTPNTSFSVSAKVGVGDGNDGFSQARKLERGVLRTEVLSANDLEDWFLFTVGREAEMTLKLVSSAKLRCLVYPAANVDLFGFTGPNCDEPYLYPIGTYRVSIGHAPPKAGRQTYTIQLR